MVQIVNQRVEIHDAHNREVVVLLNLLHSGQIAVISLLLAIQRDHQTDHFASLLLDDSHALACRCARCDHVIDHQHALVLQRAAHDAAALAVVLRLLPVVRELHVPAMRSQRRSDRRSERDSLIRRSEDHVELGRALQNGPSVALRHVEHVLS